MQSPQSPFKQQSSWQVELLEENGFTRVRDEHKISVSTFRFLSSRWLPCFWVAMLLAIIPRCSCFFVHHQTVIKRTNKLSLSCATDSALDDLQSKEAAADDEQGKIGLYVHIPYCRRRCSYCNFAIVPIGSKVKTEAKRESEEDAATQGFFDMDYDYRTSILQEIYLLREQQEHKKSPIILQSVYFGGGTPSLAPLETIRSILQAVLSPTNDHESPLFTLASDAEISIEMDPGTFSLSKLQTLHEMGFNRVSLGVQSFDDNILELIGRVHRRNDVYEAIAMIDTVFGRKNNTNNNDDQRGINYSIDLISGLPGLSLAKWTETLATAVSLKPRPCHISLYDLQIEQGTVFGRRYSGRNEEAMDQGGALLPSQDTRGAVPVTASSVERDVLPSEIESAFMYKYAAGYLRAKGYEHYEVSSYAYVDELNSGKEKQRRNNQIADNNRKRNRSRHNQIYWDVDGQWYAVGLGGTSFVNGTLTARPRALADYRGWVQDQAQGRVKENGKMDKDDILTDVILKRLRTADGLDLQWVEQNFGKDCVQKILSGADLGLELGLMTLDNNKGSDIAIASPEILRLVDPDGFLYSNNLISNIFVELGEEYYCSDDDDDNDD